MGTMPSTWSIETWGVRPQSSVSKPLVKARAVAGAASLALLQLLLLKLVQLSPHAMVVASVDHPPTAA